jgi:hypothetical protein
MSRDDHMLSFTYELSWFSRLEYMMRYTKPFCCWQVWCITLTNLQQTFVTEFNAFNLTEK